MGRSPIRALSSLVIFFMVSAAGAQERSQSLADLARKERERKKEQAKAAKVITNDDVKRVDPDSTHDVLAGIKSVVEGDASSPPNRPTDAKPSNGPKSESGSTEKAEEAKKKRATIQLSDDEQRALRIVVAIDAGEEECWERQHYYVGLEQLKNGCGDFRLAWKKGYDPQDDVEYQYSVQIISDTCQIHAEPRLSGHVGFFYDGDRLYYNPKGPASSSDETLTIRQVRDLLDHGETTK